MGFGYISCTGGGIINIFALVHRITTWRNVLEINTHYNIAMYAMSNLHYHSFYYYKRFQQGML